MFLCYFQIKASVSYNISLSGATKQSSSFSLMLTGYDMQMMQKTEGIFKQQNISFSSETWLLVSIGYNWNTCITCAPTHTHKHKKKSPNCPLCVPHFDPVSIKIIIMSHSRPCHPMLLTVPPVLQTKASSLSAGTELGAAATAVSSLHWQAELLNNTDLLRNTDAIFFPNRPSPFHFSHLPLPSLCPLLG